MTVTKKSLRKFIHEFVESEKANIDALKTKIEEVFGVSLEASDESFIEDAFRKTVLALTINDAATRVESAALEGPQKVIALLKNIRETNAFEEIPMELRGDYFAMIQDAHPGFFTRAHFIELRTSIASFVAALITTHFGSVRREQQFHEALIAVLRNAFSAHARVVAELDLVKFAAGKTTLSEVASKVRRTTLAIEGMRLLQSLSAPVIESSQSSLFAPLMRLEIGEFIAAPVTKAFVRDRKRVAEIKGKILMSRDLEARAVDDADEVHIICDTLHIDASLPKRYRGKNVAVIAVRVCVHERVTWDLSGVERTNEFDASAGSDSLSGHGRDGRDGVAGESGGNLSLECETIANAEKWTIVSNGANGAKGQDGGDGEDGESGADALENDLRTINGGSDLSAIVNTVQHGSSGSRYFSEGGIEKTIFINRSGGRDQFLLLARGARGKLGACGGFGGVGGEGGHVGKLQVQTLGDLSSREVTLKTSPGRPGENGKNGKNGLKGRDGGDAFLLKEEAVKVGGVGERLQYAIGFANLHDMVEGEVVASIVYQGGKVFLKKHSSIIPKKIRKPVTVKTYQMMLDTYEREFCEDLWTVLRNSHDNFDGLVVKLGLADFIAGKTDFKTLLKRISDNTFDIHGYAMLRDTSQKLFNYDFQLLLYLTSELKLFLEKEPKSHTSNANERKTAVVKAKIISSKNFPSDVGDSEEIHIVCDMLHIDSDLPDSYRGNNLAVYSNAIIVHEASKWDLSGRDSTKRFLTKAVIRGADGEPGESGGNCVVESAKILNGSLLSIISNGGKGSKGQDGADGRDGKDGIDATYNARTSLEKIEEQLNGGRKLVIVKGTSGVASTRGGEGGSGGSGGAPGIIQIITTTQHSAREIKTTTKAGAAGKNGTWGSSGARNSRDGGDFWFIENATGVKESEGPVGLAKFEIARINTRVFAKMSHDILLGRSWSADYELYTHLVSVLRNAHREFVNVVRALRLREYVDGRASLADVSAACQSQNFAIAHFKVLKKAAENVRVENPGLKNFIRGKIAEFIAEKTVRKEKNDAIEIVKKIITSSELTEHFDGNHGEVRVICDTLHVDGPLPKKAHGKNVAILARIVRIQEQVRWDISGENGENLQVGPAGRRQDGVGVDGVDGADGESGGNCVMQAELIENSHLLKIASNGGRGASGQEGGSGLNGIDGLDALETDLQVNAQTFGMKQDERFLSAIRNNSERQYENYSASNRDTKQSFVFADDKIGFVLARGTDGGVGRDGALGGAGGSGGHNGSIQIICPHRNAIVVEAKLGEHGKNGEDGKHGVNGLNGSDLYRVDNVKWKSSKLIGRGDRMRFHIVKLDTASEHSVWLIELKSFVHPEQSSEDISTRRSRPIETHVVLAKDKKAHTLKKKQIAFDAMKNRYQASLEIDASLSTLTAASTVQTTTETAVTALAKSPISIDRMRLAHKQDFRATTNAFREVASVERKSKSRQQSQVKLDILMRFIKEEHEEFLQRRNDQMSELERRFKVETTATDIGISHSLDSRNTKRRGVILGGNTSKFRPRATYGDLIMALVEDESAESAFKTLRECVLSLEDYAYLLKALEHFNLSEIHGVGGSSSSNTKQPVYVMHREGSYTKSRLRQLLLEKILLLHMESAFRIVIADEPDANVDLHKALIMSPMIEHDVFLRPMSGFATTLPTLDSHFSSKEENSREERELVWRVFAENEFGGSLHTCVFELLKAADPKDVNEISGFFDEPLDEFFHHREVLAFVEANIKDVGVRSPLYRGILANIFNVNLGVYVKNFDGKITLAEQHCVPEADNVIHVLLASDKFTSFEVDWARFEAAQRQKTLNDRIEMLIQGINGEIVISGDFELAKIKSRIVEHSDLDDYRLGDLFVPRNSRDDNERIKNLILSELPRDDAAYDGALDKRSSQSRYKKFVEDHLVQIDRHGGFPILNALAIRLFNEGLRISLRDFRATLQHSLALIKETHHFVPFLAFVLVGNRQSRWLTEIAAKMLGSRQGGRWRERLRAVSLKQSIPLLLDKMAKEKTAEDLTEVVESMKHMTESDYETAARSALSLWTAVAEQSKLDERVRNFGGDDNTMATLRDLKTRHGKSVDDLVAILTAKGAELRGFDLNFFLQKFASGEWLVGENVLDTLRNTPVNTWLSTLTELFEISDGQRSVEETIAVMRQDRDTSASVKEKLAEIERQALEVYNIGNASKRFIDFDEEEVKSWHASALEPKLTEALAVVLAAIRCRTKYKILMRYTQTVSVLTMWSNESGVLVQIATGEGKTLIGVAFAILKKIYKQKLDIITSSNVLAERDAVDEENKAIFGLFGIKIDHNCHEKVERRKQAYKTADILYGVLGNFQHDHMLTQFYGEEFMAGHHFSNVLVDEVDSMLLDKGNNILYLSQDLPDIEELESIFVFIWKWLNDNARFLNLLARELPKMNMTLVGYVKSVMFEAIYGTLDHRDLTSMLALDENASEIDIHGIITKLRDAGIITGEEGVMAQHLDTASFDNAVGELPAAMARTVKVFCHQKIESEKQVSVPKFFRRFVLHHLDAWIRSAFRALQMQNEREYVVDTIHSETEREPNIVILDLDTGSDMANSQWDEGLHQFLQLKHGCKLSSLSLKSVFISNVSFFQLYAKRYGMTGTLGSLRERTKLQEIHELDFATVPRHKPQRFILHPTLVHTSATDWMEAICVKVRELHEANRSALVICETIKQIKSIRQALRREIDFDRLLIYKRDYEPFNVQNLEPQVVIVATNLAGRGTDIKLSDELKKAGGLHVILTYLPSNMRVENQALGRAARAGALGSGQLIFLTETKAAVKTLKQQRDRDELVRIEEVNRYYTGFIRVEEGLFKRFNDAYRDLGRASLDEHVRTQLLENFKLHWALWLDENSAAIKAARGGEQQREHSIEGPFSDFLRKFSTSNFASLDLIPVKRVELFKHFAMAKGEEGRQLMKNIADCDDLVSVMYYEIFSRLRYEQIENQHSQRDATDAERALIKKCIDELKDREFQRAVHAQLIGHYKRSFESALAPINGFKRQQARISRVESVFVKSLYAIIGQPVTPDTLASVRVRGEMLKSNLYERLLERSILNAPRIDYGLAHQQRKVTKIANRLRIDREVLHEFLMRKNHTPLPSLSEFAREIAADIEMPSREQFWRALIEKRILTHEAHFAVVDIERARDMDPSLLEILPPQSSAVAADPRNIFFSSVLQILEEVGLGRKRVFDLEMLHEIGVGRRRQTYLEERGVLEVMIRATLDAERLRIFKNGRLPIHTDFYEMPANSFSNERIVKKLQRDKIIEHNPVTGRYKVNVQSIDDMQLDEFFAQRDEVTRVLIAGSAYRIALLKLIDDVEANADSFTHIVINLDESPHMALLHELIECDVIERATVNPDELDAISSACSESLSAGEIEELLERHGLPPNLSEGVVGELARAKLLENHFTITSFDVNERSLTGEYRTHEATIRLVLQNRRTMFEARDELRKTLEALISEMRGTRIDDPEFVLRPLEEIAGDMKASTLRFFQTKGFDMVIQIQQALYTKKYWIRFGIVLTLGISQIVAGVALTLFTLGAGVTIGGALIGEGISDMVFAFSTYSRGHFTWADYGKHKALSLFITVTTAGIGSMFSAGATLATQTVWQTLKTVGFKEAAKQFLGGGGKAVVKQILKAVSKRVARTVPSVLVAALAPFEAKIVEFLGDLVRRDFQTHAVNDTVKQLLRHMPLADVAVLVSEELAASTDGEMLESIGKIMGTMKSVIEGVDELEEVSALLKVVEKFWQGVSTVKLAADLVLVLDRLNARLQAHLGKFVAGTEKHDISGDEVVMRQVLPVVQRQITTKVRELMQKVVATDENENDGDDEEKLPLTDVVGKVSGEVTGFLIDVAEKELINDPEDENEEERLQMASVDSEGVKAITAYLQSELKKPVRIAISQNGIKHYFGAGEGDANVLDIDLQIPHDAASETIDEHWLYESLAQKHPTIGKLLSERTKKMETRGGAKVANESRNGDRHRHEKILYKISLKGDVAMAKE